MTEPALIIPMRLVCEVCGELHIDEGEFAVKPHHTHSCQFCGISWRPAIVHTVGVRFLPGFKNDPPVPTVVSRGPCLKCGCDDLAHDRLSPHWKRINERTTSLCCCFSAVYISPELPKAP